ILTWANNETVIAHCVAIAALLEVSGYPKPGNVHRTQDFGETRYEHFLVSGVTISPLLQEIAYRGFRAQKNQIGLSDLKLGAQILKGVKTNLEWQKGGNTNLGILLLFTPLACAAGMMIADPSPSLSRLRSNLGLIIKNSVSDDTINLFSAIRLANPGGLGQVDKFDVSKTPSEALKKEGINLYEIFKMSADHDNIAKEWITEFQITFGVGYPYFKQVFLETQDINVAVVHCFLKILSTYPDTLICRKHGTALAEYVSHEAKDILEKGGLLTNKELLWNFDQQLRKKSERAKINPGTTADLTAASIMVALLEGLRF
ncbi:MAG: triphosphoribosyl-dephospho-CoA synthase, partial [Candidatus Helarchaeota archaeon]|nr:triphosphoribosyl-dephospho-CoA synthase [Candidatus Helarchaeota archaeon]